MLGHCRSFVLLETNEINVFYKKSLLFAIVSCYLPFADASWYCLLSHMYMCKFASISVGSFLLFYQLSIGKFVIEKIQVMPGYILPQHVSNLTKSHINYTVCYTVTRNYCEITLIMTFNCLKIVFIDLEFF